MHNDKSQHDISHFNRKCTNPHLNCTHDGREQLYKSLFTTTLLTTCTVISNTILNISVFLLHIFLMKIRTDGSHKSRKYSLHDFHCTLQNWFTNTVLQVLLSVPTSVYSNYRKVSVRIRVWLAESIAFMCVTISKQRCDHVTSGELTYCSTQYRI